MTNSSQSSRRTWQYRFSRPGNVEIDTIELDSDDAAETHARELSKTSQIPVIIERHDLVDWEYVTEVDERG